MTDELERVTQLDWFQAYDVRDGFTLVRRNEEGKKQRFSFPHYPFYFFIREDDFSKCRDLLKQMKREGIVVRGEMASPWLKVYSTNNRGDTNPRDRAIKRLHQAGVITYEADLHNWERFIIDNDIKVATNHRVAYFDIETDDHVGGIEIGRDRIVSIGIIDDQDRRWWFCDDDERILLQASREILEQYDLIVGYNSDRFDYPYINMRLKMYGLNPLSRETVHLDAYARLERTVFRSAAHVGFQLKSWRLDDVGEATIGKKKVKHVEKIWDMFQNNRTLLEEYNMMDVEILKGICDNLALITNMQHTSQITGRPLTGVTRVGELLDIYLLKSGNARNVHYPTVSRFREDVHREEIAGGFVKDADAGLHQNVHVYDYSSMYPSIIKSWNIGLDTYHKVPGPDDIRSINGHGYIKEPGIFATTIQKLLDERKKFQEQIKHLEPGSREADNASVIQLIMKELSNSMFGIFAFQQGRFYRKDVAESITLAGQWLLRTSIQHFEAHGGTVVFGDTDSCATKFDHDVDPVAVKEELEAKLPVLLRELYNIDDAKFSIKYEKLYARLIIVTKKHYAGWIVEEDGRPSNRLFVRGLEVIKRDSVPLAKSAQSDVLNLLLNPENPYDRLLEMSVELVGNWKRRMFEEEISGEDLIIQQSVNKEIDGYKSKTLPIHVRIGQQYLKDGKELFVGQDVQYIVTSSKGGLDGVPFYTYDPEQHKPDRVYYWNHRVYSAMQRILEAAFPEHPWSIYEAKSQSGALSTQGVLL